MALETQVHAREANARQKEESFEKKHHGDVKRLSVRKIQDSKHPKGLNMKTFELHLRYQDRTDATVESTVKVDASSHRERSPKAVSS